MRYNVNAGALQRPNSEEHREPQYGYGRKRNKKSSPQGIQPPTAADASLSICFGSKES